MKLFQINEDDLAALEHTLPEVFKAMMDKFSDDNPAANRLRVHFRRVQEIVTNVRWNYGPWGSVTIIPADGLEPSEQG